MSCTIIVGGNFGDEGKGKIVSHVAHTDKPTIISRGGVGPNAGHTVIVGEKKFGVRMCPSGFVYPDARLMIGTGVLVDPRVFIHEVGVLGVEGRVFIDQRCAIIDEHHIAEDKSNTHLSQKVGSTGTGCGPANRDRAMRIARIARDIPELSRYLVDVPHEINAALDAGENVVLEGTQGFGISLYYGSYPYVTSKDTSASQMAADNGVGPTRVDEVIVVFKAFPTRVGEGPFSTEMSSEKAHEMGIQEFGTVTGRERRIGTWDPEMARYAAMVNGATQIAITGVDHIDPACFGATSYSQLTTPVRDFLSQVEADTRCPVTLVSTGPEMSQIIDLRNR